MQHSKTPSAPWDGFLSDLDAAALGMTRLDCIGGFVITQHYGMPRFTADIDVAELVPKNSASKLLELAQVGAPLHRKHGVYLQRVGIVAIPEDYESRLTEMFAGLYVNLRLMALDPYDLVLSKLERNSDRDRKDAQFLARCIPLDLDVLKQRYEIELRWQLGVPEREDLTLKLWLEQMRQPEMQ